MIATLRKERISANQKRMINEWEADPDALDEKKFLDIIEEIGKGRFAQRLISHIDSTEPPAYIGNAIRFVVNRV